MLPVSNAPALPIQELQHRYAALGPLEDWPGERTFVSRCLTFRSFIDYGPGLARDLRRAARAWGEEQAIAPNPALGRLILAAWPEQSDNQG